MIRYISNKEIDKIKWDSCVSDASNGIVYAFSWYLDIVSPGWDALVEDDYKSIFPVTHNEKYGIAYIRQPHFTQQLGVFSRGNISEELIKEYLAIISKQFKFIEMNLNTSNIFSSQDFKIDERLTYHLDLNAAYETLYKNYSQNITRNIAKAHKANLSLNVDVDAKEIVSLFRSNRGKDISLNARDYQVLLNIANEGKLKDIIKIIGATTSEGVLCAGAIFIMGLRKIIFLFSAVSPEARENGAMSLIIDHLIKTNAQKNIILDFEGSMDKNLARFYNSFGSKEAVYLHIKRNNLPAIIRWIKN